MFSLKEAAIFSPPYKGEAKKAFELFAPAIAQIYDDKTLIGSAFAFTNGCLVTTCNIENPIVRFCEGTACVSKSVGEYASIVSPFSWPIKVPKWKYTSADIGDIVFVIGYREGLLELSWCEVINDHDIRGEFTALGCLVVSRNCRVVGIVGTEFSEPQYDGFCCFNLYGEDRTITVE